MPRLCIVAKPDLVDGFRLAGAEVHPARTAELAREVLRALLKSDDVGLIALDADYYASLDDRFRRQLDLRQRPIVMPLPEGRATGGAEIRSAYVAELIQRAIGV